ncbi:MAG: methyltransferase domain-containing protein [Psychrobacter sp.]|nr:methyltransferase domain-containing protein [Psychrobacter sp.]
MDSNNDKPAPLNAEFWQQRYEAGQIGWDMGQVSPPIKAYIDQLPDSAKSLKIMMAGAGHAYEAGYLFEQGFKEVTVFDIAQAPLDSFAKRHPDFPKQQLILADFFELSPEDYRFDLAIEQTFLCAINPAMRPDYVKQMHSLLKPRAKLVGLLFDRDFGKPMPPFGGDEAEYRQLFAPYFDIEVMQRCHNSHPARQGSELFIILRRKP